MLRVLSRIQGETATAGPLHWYPGQFRKRFPNDELAPALARSALAATAIGIPDDAFEAGALLTSELVTNSVRHSASLWIEVAIVLTAEVLRIAVADSNGESSLRPRTADTRGGWGLTLLGELANRWGVDRHDGGKVIWTELDLSA